MESVLFTILGVNITLADALAFIGVVVTTAVAIILYVFGKRLTDSGRLSRRESLQKRIHEHLYKIKHEGINSKVELVNLRRKKDYPFNNKKSKKGYTYEAHELKDVRYDGFEFVNSISEVYYNDKDELTFKKTKKKADFNVIVVGITPYEWIDFIDLEGDEYSEGRPQFFLKFKGKKGEPFYKAAYYRNTNAEKSDIHAIQYESVEIKDGWL